MDGWRSGSSHHQPGRSQVGDGNFLTSSHPSTTVTNKNKIYKIYKNHVHQGQQYEWGLLCHLSFTIVCLLEGMDNRNEGVLARECLALLGHHSNYKEDVVRTRGRRGRSLGGTGTVRAHP